MKITALRSDKIYEEIIQAAPDEKLELYRERMMSPFMNKWNIQQIPFRSSEPHGFDVIMMNNFMNIAPADITPEISEPLAAISSEAFWQECHEAVRTSLSTFTEDGIELSASEYLYTILLGDKNSPTLQMNEGICGDGGIPGYIIANLIPNRYTLPRMQSVLAHECNHNVRYQHIQWNPQITLGEMIISEGLAENFATSLYGEELLGPWVAKTDMETLNTVIRPKMKDQLHVTGFDQINPYLYGDELATLQNFTPVGMPYAAGYACGYHLIQYYLNKTGKSITEATITPASVILAETKDFWNEDTLFHR
ncbi:MULTISPECIES: DUF2268 domain-containing protein [unclassified Paenibacillus]|uniref:DUF2268 domain-containing protein n=1 Tax=unclassified Paenibacillus TaxID=185978 RepID=UPI00040581BA|nr:MULTISPECIES: DUF2268 domain-containing protein [unclassified Paenibacillus]KGP84604.1 Zn-dependent protease [Paenibacillus sp. MAEPY2]KGP86771.1 Zn-dependent protease [Paenibacillus sp. MAEPY1]